MKKQLFLSALLFLIIVSGTSTMTMSNDLDDLCGNNIETIACQVDIDKYKIKLFDRYLELQKEVMKYKPNKPWTRKYSQEMIKELGRRIYSDYARFVLKKLQYIDRQTFTESENSFNSMLYEIKSIEETAVQFRQKLSKENQNQQLDGQILDYINRINDKRKSLQRIVNQIDCFPDPKTFDTFQF